MFSNRTITGDLALARSNHGDQLGVDTTAGPITVTLPADPPTWFTVSASVTAGANTVTVISGGSELIQLQPPTGTWAGTATSVGLDPVGGRFTFDGCRWQVGPR